jgi:glutathione peroxidase
MCRDLFPPAHCHATLAARFPVLAAARCPRLQYGMDHVGFTALSQGIDGNRRRITCGGTENRQGWRVMRAIWATAVMLWAAGPVAAADSFRFASIDGGEIDLADWRGKPILVVNTASLCGFAEQFGGLQDLYEQFGTKALILAVPSDDFNQELGSEAEVKEYCAMTFDITLPMTEITRVRGNGAHPFYAWVREETGFVPRWNFNKVLIGTDGAIVGTFGSNVEPQSRQIAGQIEAMLQ